MDHAVVPTATDGSDTSSTHEYFRQDGNKIIHRVVQSKEGIFMDNTKGHPLGSVVAMVLVPKEKYDSMEKKIKELELKMIAMKTTEDTPDPVNINEFDESSGHGEVYDEKEVLDIIEASKNPDIIQSLRKPQEGPQEVECPQCTFIFKMKNSTKPKSGRDASGSSKKGSRMKPY